MTAVGSAAAAATRPDPRVEVIVELDRPPAARSGFTPSGPARERRAAVARIETQQRAFLSRLRAAFPVATVGWRYRIVMNGLAVSVPRGALARLARLPGVSAVYPSLRYHALLDRSPEQIGAPVLWGPDLENAGDGIKIGIIDDGIDQTHPFFRPDGYSMPSGYPKGRVRFTTAKVIVARAFPPAGAKWRYAAVPFDPINSFHGTHVAGIAAGNHGTLAFSGPERVELSGVAPRAFLGNYKALTYPTESGLGLNGNSPEIVAAIEAAVADGMDVINLSLGEPQVEPDRDAVAKALDNAAAAGVVPVVAAGNEFEELGLGSVGSPGTSREAITVGATTRNGALAWFSASGPTPLGEELKPDVSAPGVGILSSVPGGGFEEYSGTSMASPHVAGGAALLREAHPDWTVAQIKSSLVLTGTQVRAGGSTNSEVPATREGGGQVDLPAASSSSLFASPQTVSFGLLDIGTGAVEVERDVGLSGADAAGRWSVSIDNQRQSAGVSIQTPATVEVPGVLTVAVFAAQDAREGEQTGFIVLTHAGLVRRLPFWFRVTRPMLPDKPFRVLAGSGLYQGNTRGQTALVDRYRYPEGRTPSRRLRGPEQVFRLTLEGPVANVGVAVTSRSRNVDAEPRIVLGADENRLAGATALPFVANPYLSSFSAPVRSAAMLLPSAGTYSVVFDTPSAAAAGRYAFRLWIDDVTPPSVSLRRRVARNGLIAVRVGDRGAGVDPQGITFSVDGGLFRRGRLAGPGLALLDVSHLRPGTHRLVLRVSDRQEAKNNENVARILPNTRIVETTIKVL